MTYGPEKVRYQTLSLRHLNLPKPKMGSYEPLFFWFQRGLVSVTALRRLPKLPKLVSKSRLSLIDRPRPSEGRFQNNVHLQALVDLGRAPFSKVQMVSKFALEQKRRLQRVVMLSSHS